MPVVYAVSIADMSHLRVRNGTPLMTGSYQIAHFRGDERYSYFNSVNGKYPKLTGTASLRLHCVLNWSLETS